MKVIANGAVGQLAVGWLTMFVIGTDLFVVSPLLPLIAVDYQISPALAGLSVTVFSLTYMVSAPLLGHVADRIGRRRTLTCCLLAFAAANLATASVGSFVWLLAARLISGAAAAGVSPAIYALVGVAAPLDRRATWLALVTSGLLVSLPLGAPIAALASASLGWSSNFVALAALSLLLAWANRRIWPEDHGARTIAAPVGSLTATAIALRLAPMVVWSTVLYGMYTYLGAGLTSSGFSTEQIAEVIVFYGCGAIGGVLIGGRMGDRLGAKLMGGISLSGLAVCLLLLRLALETGILVNFAFGLTSAVAQLFFPAQQAGLANNFPTRRATVMAWNNSALFLGISLGSLIGGQAILFGSFEANLTISAAIAIAGWMINWAVMPDPVPPRTEAVARTIYRQMGPTEQIMPEATVAELLRTKRVTRCPTV
jgi:predicted MFS family arabinose efflux permease